MIHMKKILLSLVLLSAYSLALGQFYQSPQFLWEQSSNIGYGEAIQFWNNALYITGNDLQTQPPGGLLLQKLDTSGTVLWNKPLSLPASNLTGEDLLLLPNGNIVVGGTHFDQNSQQFMDWIGFFDSNGDTLFHHSYSHSTSPVFVYHGKRLIQHSQGGYLMAGNILFRVDSSGTELWSKQVVSTDVAQTSDGGFVICGAKVIGPASISFVWKFDANGDSLWYHELTSLGSNSTPTVILENPISQELIVLGSAYNSNGVPDADIFIQRFSASGSFLNHRFMVRQGDDLLNHADWGGIGEIMMTTHASDSATGLLVSLMGINETGDLLYDHVRGDLYLDDYRASVIDDLGRFIYCIGTFQGFVAQVQYKKLDLINVLSVDDPIVTSYLRLFPNPVQSVLHISPVDAVLTGWSLWDAQGRLVKQGNFPVGQGGDWQIGMEGLLPGVYWLSYEIEGKGRLAQPVVMVR